MKADCVAEYHSGRVPFADRMPCGRFLAAAPMASSSAAVAKSLFATLL